MKKHSFSIWIVAAVFLAIAFPGPASEGGFLRSDVTTRLGVWIIFFLQGLSLPTSQLTAGYKPKRLHVFVLSWNYLWFPLLTGLLLLPLSFFVPESLRLGFWLLAILPTTISSAIALSAVAGGNTANALFSCVFSNLLSVFLVPSMAVAYLAMESSAEVAFGPMLQSLVLLIIVPLVMGQILRKLASGPARFVTAKTKSVSNGIIVFIVHAAFARSVSSGFLEGLPWPSIVAVILGTLGVLLVVSRVVWISGGWIRLTAAQRISAFYCASQKSLATGLPLATSILAAAPGIVDPAAVLIPLMCYHPAQLILGGWLSGRFQRDS